jgi:hypothetical protein
MTRASNIFTLALLACAAACNKGSATSDGAGASTASATSTATASAAQGATGNGCKADNDCKGNRICVNGACADPPASATAKATGTPTAAAATNNPANAGTGVTEAKGGPGPEDDPNPVTKYRARLSGQDHLTSKGVKLATPSEVLQQDRANYHTFNKRDPEDETDTLFLDLTHREKMNQYLAPLTTELISAIEKGTPLVEVSVFHATNGYRAEVLLLSE